MNRPEPGQKYYFPKSPRLIVEDVGKNHATGEIEVIARYDWWGITIWSSLEDWDTDRKGAEPEEGLWCIINCGREAKPHDDPGHPGPRCKRHAA